MIIYQLLYIVIKFFRKILNIFPYKKNMRSICFMVVNMTLLNFFLTCHKIFKVLYLPIFNIWPIIIHIYSTRITKQIFYKNPFINNLVGLNISLTA